MNILDKIDQYIKEQDEKCSEGEQWCPVEKKCIPIGSGKGDGPRKRLIKNNEI